ncbi:carbohydrate porin [Kaarinaea lacus]
MKLELIKQDQKSKKVACLFILFLTLWFFSTYSFAQQDNSSQTDTKRVPQFGGPSSVGGQFNEDKQPREPYFRFEGIQKGLAPWFDWKKRMFEENGLALGVNYMALYQTASESLGEDKAFGGIFQLPISWTVMGKGSESTGTIVFKLENRHRLGTDIAPQSLGLPPHVSAAAITGTMFSDYDGWGITNLYWQHKMKGGHLNYVAGIVDVTDYLDIYGMINPLTAFQNLVFSTNPTIASPNQGLGGAFGTTMASGKMYVVAGLSDANADPTETGDSIDSFFSDNDYFYHAELGWVSSFDRRYFDNTHITVWSRDADKFGNPDGWGLAFSWAKFIDDRMMPFVRVGHSDGGGGALLENMISAGLGIYRKSHDLFGVGFSWGEVSEKTFAPGLDDQYTAEVFYRMTLSPNFALTPDLQLLVNPALNPNESQVWIAGLRARLAL